MPTDIVVEGPDDRALVVALCPQLAPVTPRPEGDAGGREQAMVRAAVAATGLLAPRRVVLVLDWNGSSRAGIDAEVERVLTGKWGSPPQRRGSWFVQGESGVRVVLAGLPEDPLLRTFGITRPALDDYVLRLLLAEDSLAAFIASENAIAHRPRDADELGEVLRELAALLARRGAFLETSKRYLDLIDAVLGLRFSSATRAQLVIARSPSARVTEILDPFRHCLCEDPPF